MILSKAFVLLFISLVLLFGCTNQSPPQAPQQPALPSGPAATSQQTPPAVTPNASGTNASGGPAPSQQQYGIVKFRVDSNTPGSRIAGQAFYDTVYLDLSDESYTHAISDGSQALFYTDGAYYKATNISGKCFVSSIKEDFTANLQRDEVADLALFLFVEETLKPELGSAFETSASQYLQKTGPDSYELNGIKGFSNSVFNKYGDLYLGSNVTYSTGSLTYNYVYSSLEPLSKSDYDAAQSQEMSKWKGCKDISGGPNPLPS